MLRSEKENRARSSAALPLTQMSPEPFHGSVCNTNDESQSGLLADEGGTKAGISKRIGASVFLLAKPLDIRSCRGSIDGVF